MTPNPDALSRLHRLLGDPALAALRQRLRRAYEQAGPGQEPGLLRLLSLAPHEAEALQALTGRPARLTASAQIDLAALGARLKGAGLANGMRHALELLDGPIQPLAAERAAAAAAWSALAAQSNHAALASLLRSPYGLGLLRRLSAGDAQAARALCEHASRVLAALPAQGQPRASLAALCLGDAHALDKGRPVATLVLAALRLAGQNPATGDGETDGESEGKDDSDEGARALWAAQGVSVNELARPALTLNLPLSLPFPLSLPLSLDHPHDLSGLAAEGEPRYWSLRQLLRSPPLWRVAGRDVFVCENPNLLAMAADALGSRCAPLVCTDGMPAAAQRALLAQLAAAGAKLRYHGDFDWPGIAIGNRVLQDFGASAWCFAATDYSAAAQLAAGVSMAPLRGNAVSALWDESLASTMQQAGRAIAEEALLDALLPDLASPLNH